MTESETWELEQLADELRRAGVRSYLEIGSRRGVFFSHIMRTLPDATGVAVDLPNAAWGRADSEQDLRRVVESLHPRATAIFGDSHDEAIRDQVRALGPFDACLIDADHRYEQAKSDWRFARSVATIVAFHDIDYENGPRPSVSHEGETIRVEVPRLWKEIKTRYRHCEIVGPRRGFGFGILYQQA